MQARLGLAIVVGGVRDRRLQRPRPTPPGELVFIPLLFAIVWLAGFALRERAEQAEAAEERAAHAEREREAAARIAVAEERARIARELHDIVAHAVSVMVLQVGAVRHRLPDALADDAEALRGRRADRAAAPLAEMRRLLGAMRREGDDLELAPAARPRQPRAAARGGPAAPACPSTLHVEGEPVPLPRAIDLSAYRIVQEGLTNALKHARASHADVTVRYRPDELQIEVRDDGHGPTRAPTALGHGLVGIRERVKLYGGEMTRRRGERRRLRRSARASRCRRAAMSIRVLVADDQSMVRAGFRMLLAGEEDIEVVAEASNGLEAVDKAARFQPDVVLMDIRMPELDGLEATRRILAADAAARILILTTFDLDEYIYEALSAGASGFVLKDDPPEQLIAAIRTVAAGDALLSPAVTQARDRAVHAHRRAPAPPKELDELTARELRRLPPDRPRPLERGDRRASSSSATRP